VAADEAAAQSFVFENRVVLVGDPEEDIDWDDPSVGRRSPVVDDGEQPAA